MATQLTCQRYILKLRSGRLRRAKWDLTLPIEDARLNDEVVSLADSQVLRWIDELNGVTDADARAREIKASIKAIRQDGNSVQNKKKLRALYAELDRVQFKPDYLCIIMEKEKDYIRLCQGFKINGIDYVRLLGTNGGIKNSTIVFVSARLAPELRRRIENGRDPMKEMVPAKLEAYRALVCSGSTPVSWPNGIAVVNDAVVKFKSDVINIDDSEDGDPKVWFQEGAEVELDESDGYGIMLPSLAERWSREIGLDYVMSGCNSRNSYEKGMIFTFDFLDFADKLAGHRIVKDAWGNDVDLGNVELVLTTSMLKLWDSYDNCEDYIRHCKENNYTFGIPKVCPKELENERNLNYQFIQPEPLNDDDIEELIKPTIDEIRDVLGMDWRKTVLFLRGGGLTEKNVLNSENDIAKAIMINPEMIKDPYIINRIYVMIRKRINDAKIGVIKVHGNYSILSGDPYALCQSMLGLPVTGLLKAGEIYSEYWMSLGVNKVLCARAPMTSANNILTMNIHDSDEARYWYRYMKTCTMTNAHDCLCMALNGADKDGDLIFTTDNPVLLRRHRNLPTLMCMQRRAQKCIPTEEDIIKSNIASFGDEIGKITNRVTSMFDVQAQYEPGTKEYEVLDYRIKTGQLFQQNFC